MVSKVSTDLQLHMYGFCLINCAYFIYKRYIKDLFKQGGTIIAYFCLGYIDLWIIN